MLLIQVLCSERRCFIVEVQPEPFLLTHTPLYSCLLVLNGRDGWFYFLCRLLDLRLSKQTIPDTVALNLPQAHSPAAEGGFSTLDSKTTCVVCSAYSQS